MVAASSDAGRWSTSSSTPSPRRWSSSSRSCRCEPAPGLFFFAAVVVLTMLAVESFDPRLIWDPASPTERFAMPDATIAARRSRVASASPRSSTRLSLVWIIPIVAALVGVWVAVTRILERGADDHDRLPVGRGTRGRQDQDPLQRRRRRHDHDDPAVGRSPARDRHRADGAEDRGLPGRGHAVLGRARRASRAPTSPAWARSSPAPTSAWRSATSQEAQARVRRRSRRRRS